MLPYMEILWKNAHKRHIKKRHFWESNYDFIQI